MKLRLARNTVVSVEKQNLTIHFAIESPYLTRLGFSIYIMIFLQEENVKNKTNNYQVKSKGNFNMDLMPPLMVSPTDETPQTQISDNQKTNS